MNGNTVAGIGCLVMVAVLGLVRPSHAGPTEICKQAQLRGELLGICSAYVTGQDCLEPGNHDAKRCAALRRVFREMSGLDLDGVLAQDSIRTLVPVAGGTVILSGFGSVTFPAGAFEKETLVEVATGRDAAVAAVFNEFASIFRPSSRLGYEVTVTTGVTPPLSDGINIRLNLPAEFLAEVPAGYGVELFAMVEQASDLDLPFASFELFESHLTGAGDAIEASIPAAVFMQDSSGQYKAVFTLAPTPGEKDPPSVLMESALHALQSGLMSTSQCEAASISCPVSGGCEVTSRFNKARKHPVTGATRPHYGVDYKASTGTPILSAASGTIERSYSSSSYGETIIVRHDDGGATLYAHLQTRDVQQNDRVRQGQTIGTANNTGLSSGPHLHFEYVPNGEIIQSKSRIDPDACVDAQGSGSVTVSDSGSLADDAFGVAIDGYFIGQTSIGASNTLAISNLKVGQHTLTLTVLIAPDNVGTYTVQLNDGLKFADGSTSKRGSAPQGATLNWQFVVP